MSNLHILCGHGAPVLGKLLLKKILWGILRYQGQSRILQQPVTPRVLLAIRSILRPWVGERDFTLIWAAVTLVFFAFLRCSEFTCRGTTSYSPRPVYLYNQIWLARSGSVFLHLSKTDTFRRGHTLAIACSPSTLCAVKAMLNYFLLVRPQGPFFHFIPVVHSQGNRLFPFSETRLVRPFYPKVLLRDIIFDQSAYSIFARCQALVIFLRLVFSEFSRVEVKF